MERVLPAPQGLATTSFGSVEDFGSLDPKKNQHIQQRDLFCGFPIAVPLVWLG